VETLEAGKGSVDLNDDLVGHLEQLGGSANGGTGDDAAILQNLGSLNDDDVELVVGLVLGVVTLLPGCQLVRAYKIGGSVSSYVDKVNGEHGQVLVEELDAALIDALGDVLADLMRAAALNHVKTGPAVLGLSAGGGADEKAVLELTLKVVLLDMVGQESRRLPVRLWSLWSAHCLLHLSLSHCIRRLSVRDEARCQCTRDTYLGYPTPVKPDQPM